MSEDPDILLAELEAALQRKIAALIVAALVDAGVHPAPDLVADLTEAVDYTAELKLSFLTMRDLPQTPGGEAIARFLNRDGDSIRQAADRIGCSPSSLLRAERQLRRFLGLPRLSGEPEIRFTSAGANCGGSWGFPVCATVLNRVW
ncbi:MAG TPA: hypothetical protein VMS21_00330 [Methylomirabilota bacterium]|nr:hypothetical protein [Methylomirabilota bacterium]